MSDELKPCHRCGKPAEHADRYDGEQTVTDYGACCCANVECPEFGCQYDVEIWNARPIEDALRERIKELEEMNQAMHPENAPKDCWPVVVYLPTAQDRDDLIAACGREKPAMKAHAAVYRKR